jgi:hypothetical protein
MVHSATAPFALPLIWAGVIADASMITLATMATDAYSTRRLFFATL